MLAIDEVVELLKDGEWHSLNQIEKKLNLTKNRMEKIVQLLCQLDFIALNDKLEKVAIDPDLREIVITEQNQHRA